MRHRKEKHKCPLSKHEHIVHFKSFWKKHFQKSLTDEMIVVQRRLWMKTVQFLFLLVIFYFPSFPVIFSFIRGDKHTFILCRRVVETPILTTTTTTLLFAVTGYNAYRRHWQFHKWGEIMMYVIKKHSVKTRGVLKLDVLKGLVL